MFAFSIEMFGTPEQVAKWRPLTKNFNIIGSYAQTELGHGSNVAGLETTATFDPLTDEFVINTPHIKAAKFWPGQLGVAATHSILFARLITKGKDFGVQPFMV